MTTSPTFLGIGAAKCGTTTLAAQLAAHPQIAFPRSGRKELHYFDERELTAESLDRYLSEFPEASPQGAVRASGEFTPSYLFDPACRDRIHTALGGEMRFLVVLRSPIDRAWSHYCHAVREWSKPESRRRGYPVEDLSFEDALRAEQDRLRSGRHHIRHLSYFTKGLYAQQLDRWFEKFDRRSTHITLLDDLVSEPVESLRTVFRFLGVDEVAPIADPGLRLNSKSLGRCPEGARAWLSARYEDDVRRLSELLGRDLSGWLDPAPIGADSDMV